MADKISAVSAAEINPSTEYTPLEEQTTPEEQPLPEKKHLPSHSTLAMSNYPPWWTKDRKKPTSPDPKPARNPEQAGLPLSTIQSVQKTTSSREDRKGSQWNEKDPSNKHQYLQQPDRAYTHPRLNIFGRDIGPLGKPPSLFTGSKGSGFSFGRKKK